MSECRDIAEYLVRYDRQILRYIMTFLPRRDDAEEVLQRTAVVLWEKFDQFDRERDFLPWALRFAYFEVLNYRKQIARDRLVFSEQVIQMLAETRKEQADELEKRREALRECVQRLQPEDRELLQRRYSDAETISSLAGIAGKTAKALYRRLDRVRESLAKCVDRRVTAS